MDTKPFIQRGSLARSVAAHFGLADDVEPPISAIMTTCVVALKSGMSIEEVRSLFLEHDVTGAPVIDPAGKPIGMISGTDLLRCRTEPAWDEWDVRLRGRGDDGFTSDLPEDLSPRITVDDMTTGPAFCLPLDTTVSQAAAVMVSEGVHRIVVIDGDGHMVGMLTSLDLLEAWPGLSDDILFPDYEASKVPVSRIMRTSLVTAHRSDSASCALGMMRTHHLHHLPVLVDHRVVGVVSERGIRAMARQMNDSELRLEMFEVDEVMTDEAHCLPSHTPVQEAAELLRDRAIGCVCIVDNDRLVGVISRSDLLRRIPDVREPAGSEDSYRWDSASSFTGR